jgi:hypothetical protein
VPAAQAAHAATVEPPVGLYEPALQLYAGLQAVDEVEPTGDV